MVFLRVGADGVKVGHFTEISPKAQQNLTPTYLDSKFFKSPVQNTPVLDMEDRSAKFKSSKREIQSVLSSNP